MSISGIITLMMNRYLVVTPTGKIMMFYVKACAKIFAGENEIKELIIDTESGQYVERL
jgi:hypothetical protein